MSDYAWETETVQAKLEHEAVTAALPVCPNCGAPAAILAIPDSENPDPVYQRRGNPGLLMCSARCFDNAPVAYLQAVLGATEGVIVVEPTPIEAILDAGDVA